MSNAQQQLVTVSGVVRDSTSGEVVIGATCALYADSVSGKPLRGGITNKYGFFSIPKVALRSYYLVVRSIGYKSSVIAIVTNDLNQLEEKKVLPVILLQPISVTSKEVVVEADRASTTPTAGISSVTINSDFIRSMPALLGETDVFRVMQLLPGVKSPSELSSGLYVRGGSPDQNLVLLDGAIVYNPAHLGGFLSTFNNDALRDVRLIKGGFPAEYGGRLSSVIDMTMKEGTKEKVKGQGGVSIIASRLTVEGPINEDATFMISARRMYLDLLLNLFLSKETLQDVPNYYFYDLNAKVNYKVSENDRIFLSGFFGRDVITSPEKSSDFNINWGNATANARWMHIFTPEVFSNFSVIYTNYNFGSELGRSGSSGSLPDFFTRSRVRDITLKGDVQYFASDNHTLKFGIEATQHRFTTAVSDSLIGGSELGVTNTINDAIDGALYVQDEWRISDDLFANIGGRLYYFQTGNYLRFEPRLQLAWSVAENTKLISSFAVANQFLHLIVRNDINLPTDLWFPSTRTILPGQSMQGVLGIEHTFDEGRYLFSAEAYYKDIRNVYEYKDNATFSLFTPVESQFTRGRAESYGLELFLHKRVGDFTGWVGYTLSWARRFFDELNNGKPFWARYDRRHDVSATFSYNLGKGVEFGAAWTFGTGFAYTMPTAQYYGSSSSSDFQPPSVLFTERNGYRLPPYHRLDINLGFKAKVFGLKSIIALSIYNVYNRLNPFAQYISNEYDPVTQGSKPVLKQITLFPILPVLSWSFDF